MTEVPEVPLVDRRARVRWIAACVLFAVWVAVLLAMAVTTGRRPVEAARPAPASTSR